jgi:rod shape-determining protein MreC
MARVGFGRRRTSPTNRLVAILAVAALALIIIDMVPVTKPLLTPLRAASSAVIGPSESLVHGATAPVRALRQYTQTNSDLRNDVARLSNQNSELRSQAELAGLDRARLVDLEGLTKMSSRSGYQLIPARVVAMGPMQSFSRTVTIDVGTNAGVHKDMTVVNRAGLVGRVVAASHSTATVLLIIDTDSVVGGRLGESLEIGFLKGRGSISSKGRMDLDMVDDSVTPSIDDVVVTWGSKNDAPYVAGIPIGTIESVFSTPGQLGKHAVVKPLVDFSSLDVVGVAIPKKPSAKAGDR